MDGECEAVWTGQFLETRQYVKRSVDGHRHDRQAQFVGELERSFLEVAHVTGECARPLGEDDQRSAIDEGVVCLGYRAAHPATACAVDEDVACGFARPADEGYLAQALFHHPFEVAPQIAVDEEYVEDALMVGHEDIGMAVVNLVASGDFDPYEKQAADGTRPQPAGVITPEVRVTHRSADDGRRGSYDGSDNPEWDCDAKHIDVVKQHFKLHFDCFAKL